jgi:hypothetical protein
MKALRVTEPNVTHLENMIALFWVARLHPPSMRRKVLYFSTQLPQV